VRVPCTAAWPDLAPFRVGAVIAALHTLVVEAPLEGEVATLPPLPESHARRHRSAAILSINLGAKESVAKIMRSNSYLS